MLLPRELIYRERRLEEFNFKNPESLFFHLYENLSCEAGMTPHDAGAYETITKTLNLVCYICTDALLQPVPKLAFGDYVKYVENVCGLTPEDVSNYVTIVLKCVSIVFNWGNIEWNNYEHIDLINDIDEWLEEVDKYSLFDDYFEDIQGFLLIDAGFVTPRPINEDFLQTINWQRLTNDYNLDCIRFIVRNISKDDNVKLKVIQSIREEVSDNDPNQLPF